MKALRNITILCQRLRKQTRKSTGGTWKSQHSITQLWEVKRHYERHRLVFIAEFINMHLAFMRNNGWFEQKLHLGCHHCAWFIVLLCSWIEMLGKQFEISVFLSSNRSCTSNDWVNWPALSQILQMMFGKLKWVNF